uniref:Uncharacterized protein n=1 Tax=Physcomitrium patens TaxID=3218 RepID=A9S691_PHYPA|nr:hypothetical protein PHYPA_013410 [Physcomitrium patens]
MSSYLLKKNKIRLLLEPESANTGTRSYLAPSKCNLFVSYPTDAWSLFSFQGPSCATCEDFVDHELYGLIAMLALRLEKCVLDVRWDSHVHKMSHPLNKLQSVKLVVCDKYKRIMIVNKDGVQETAPRTDGYFIKSEIVTIIKSGLVTISKCKIVTICSCSVC